MTERLQQTCQVCGDNVGFTISDDGFFYCDCCNSQADGMVDTGVDEENIFNRYSVTHSRARPVNVCLTEPVSQVKDQPYILENDGRGQVGCTDFGSSQNDLSYGDYYTAIRSRYLTGLQIMIQLQCQSLVENFNVSPLIIGLIGPIWLRFLSSTRIMADEWADMVVHESETQTQGEPEEFQFSATYRGEPVNILGKRMVMIWYRSLRSTIPIQYSLAISFLVCHVAREAVLPPDILKWALEGRIPYFSAFCEIEKRIGSHSRACPISGSKMYRPIQSISSQKLESIAAQIAQKIGLELPPVNFYAIASRYCRQLLLPSEKILPLAIRIYEWSMPSELYLSANEHRIPTRACVMSILIIAVRILFDINGRGMWESSLSSTCSKFQCGKDDLKSQLQSNITEDADFSSSPDNSKPHLTKSHTPDSRLDGSVLLRNLDTNLSNLGDTYAYNQDLSSYLRYCKDVVFSGLQPTFEDFEEEKLMREFWELYHTNKGGGKTSSREDISENYNNDLQDSQSSGESQNDNRLRRMKLDMEENKFCYIPPKVKVKGRETKDYIHYARKKDELYIYAVHADYYILLQSCAKVAHVEARIMHLSTLNVERRLNWLEKRIGSSLNFKIPADTCDFCYHENVENGGDIDTNKNM